MMLAMTSYQRARRLKTHRQLLIKRNFFFSFCKRNGCNFLALTWLASMSSPVIPGTMNVLALIGQEG